ncbi:hypothetical protein PS627_04289 [Pseudomonas fluorescens]|nr:hypothetical protein PS627_04289 [Pseudomonas fluorescens]
MDNRERALEMIQDNRTKGPSGFHVCEDYNQRRK